MMKIGDFQKKVRAEIEEEIEALRQWRAAVASKDIPQHEDATLLGVRSMILSRLP